MTSPGIVKYRRENFSIHPQPPPRTPLSRGRQTKTPRPSRRYGSSFLAAITEPITHKKGPQAAPSTTHAPENPSRAPASNAQHPRPSARPEPARSRPPARCAPYPKTPLRAALTLWPSHGNGWLSSCSRAPDFPLKFFSALRSSSVISPKASVSSRPMRRKMPSA